MCPLLGKSNGCRSPGVAGIATLGALLEVTRPDLQEAAEMGAHLGWRLRRNVK